MSQNAATCAHFKTPLVLGPGLAGALALMGVEVLGDLGGSEEQMPEERGRFSRRARFADTASG